MSHGANEVFSRVLIDKVLEFSSWNPLDLHQVRYELNTPPGGPIGYNEMTKLSSLTTS